MILKMNKTDEFKVVGYYPEWEPDKLDRIQYDILSHINYAFAIPTAEGSLLPLKNPDTAVQIIEKAHQNGVKVLLVIGGWSHEDIPLEAAFVEATDTKDKIKKLGDTIIAMAKQYGFDGVDIDWEHPRIEGNSKNQYEELMVYLRKEADKNNMLLTAAVLGGATVEGDIAADSAAQTDKVIEVVDWFNVMAYDGAEDTPHSTYEFAVNCGKYWRDLRKMPKEKVVLGVPFYGKPLSASYSDILSIDEKACNLDTFAIDGAETYYNGIPTIKQKALWACGNMGGIMIWELSQDVTDMDKSLLKVIGDTVRNSHRKE